MDYIAMAMQTITTQINSIIESDKETYGGCSFVIADERMYAKDEKDSNKVYIVVRFSPASMDFGQVLLPLSIYALGASNKLYVCQRLMFDFAERFTQRVSYEGTDTVKQIYQTPSVSSNFNDIWTDLRTMFSVAGTFLIGRNSNNVEYLEIDSGEVDGDGHPILTKVDVITFSTQYACQVDSQAYSQNNDFAVSLSKISSFAIAFTMFCVDNDFVRKCFAIQALGSKDNQNEMPSVDDGINTTFKVRVKYRIFNAPFVYEMKLYQLSMQQNKGDLPTLAITMMR